MKQAKLTVEGEIPDLLLNLNTTTARFGGSTAKLEAYLKHHPRAHFGVSPRLARQLKRDVEKSYGIRLIKFTETEQDSSNIWHANVVFHVKFKATPAVIAKMRKDGWFSGPSCTYCDSEAVWNTTYHRRGKERQALTCDVHRESAIHNAEQAASPITSIIIARIAD
jgi:hypothetical protein